MVSFPFCKKTKIKTQQKRYFQLRIAILALFILLPTISQARTFDPNNIITDQELIDQSSLSKTAIQKFLEREDSVLARYSQIIDNRTLKASEIIWEIGQKHQINPKFLLTTLEKEQGLISKNQATEKALDWATGYGCYGGTCKEKYRGFYNQVEATAETQRIYWDKAGQFSFNVGQTTKTFDNYAVTPANKATANLYIYTPYVGNAPELGISSRYGANKLFWRIWHRYFSSQKFLDGQVITFNGEYWLIKNNQKRKFISQDLFLKDYKTSDAINVSSSDLAAYPNGPAINFANNTLVKTAESGQIYLLTENQKRPLTDNNALTLLSDFQIATSGEEIPIVDENQLTGYDLGASISNSSVYPQGKLFLDETGKIWQVKDGLKHEVDNLVWQNNFNSTNLESITLAELEKYPTGNPVLFADGTFIKNNDKYYLISSEERMKVNDEGIFNRHFGLTKKSNALQISTALLEVHPAGEMIDYIDDTITDAIITNNQGVINENYQAIFNSMTPDGLVMVNGTSQNATLTFKNTGTNTWQEGEVWLKVTDKDKETSSFTALAQVDFSETSVAASQLANFTLNLTAPTNQSGLLNQKFTLYYNKNGTPTEITSITKFVIVKPGISAQVIEHNLPVAVKNTWKPITITMKIKNTSADTTWLAKKTALAIYNADGSTSYFYDPNDWVRKDVAAVPIGKTYIKPGEIGEFKFTLDPRHIKKNNYIMKFKLKLLDKDKEVYLNGQLEWPREIRVD